MIQIYEFYSNPLGCTVTVSYNDGKLYAFQGSEPTFDINKTEDTKYSLFFTESAFLKAVKEHDVKVTILKREVTFDMFWDRYNYKVGKAEAEKTWNKLSQRDRLEAYDYILAYESFRKVRNHDKLYGQGYLTARRWVK